MKRTLDIVSTVLLYIVALAFVSCTNTYKKASRTEKRDQILKSIVPPKIPTDTLSILSFGAVGDSITDCKPAFDKAMKACKKIKGTLKGTRIVVPAGTYYLNGPIHMVSNVCIELRKGARLKFGSNPERYLPVVLTSWEGTLLYNYSPFIYGYKLENVSIIGQGIIDGNSSDTFSKWADMQGADQNLSRAMNQKNVPLKKRIFGRNHFLRPQFIQFFKCKNILIDGVTITDSPFWCIHLLKSENATIRNVTFHALNKNNDGIDPEYSKNILIENVHFNNADDNIAIKSGRDREGRSTVMPSENIVIRNCVFKGLNGLAIGSEMSSGVRDVFLENCSSGGYCRRGIFIKSNPDCGGFITDIYINNVKFGQVEDCFFITSRYHNEGKGNESSIGDMYIDSLKCSNATEAGLVIQGYLQNNVKNICFSNVFIDTARIGLCFTNTKNILLNNIRIGERVQSYSYTK